MYTSSSTAATCRLSFLRKLLLLLLCLQPSLSSLVFISSKCRRRQRRTTLAATNDGRHHHQQQQQHDDNEMKRIIPQALQRVQSSPSTPPLPILKVLDQVCASLVERPNLLLEAPPGAGKTTILPLALLAQIDQWRSIQTNNADTINNNNNNNPPPRRTANILVVEPRRVAARSAAVRMAALLQQQVGETVGYAMRGETVVQALHTQITVVTDGVLLQRLRRDPALTGVQAVILDEFLERGVNTDVALALLMEMQQVLRPSLRVIVMSATLFDETKQEQQEEGRLLRAMGGSEHCNIVASRGGRQYPITIQWADASRRYPPLQVLLKSRPELVQTMSAAIQDAARQAPAGGDVLAFLPGTREIQLVVQELKQQQRNNKKQEILPLYGTLPKAEQDYAIQPPPPDKQDVQRIIVASPIAEASLTLERVTAVVDSGLRREPRCDVDTGMPRLVTSRCSKAAATQRAGRAGRVREGLCIRIYSEAEMQERFLEHSLPEIASTDLVPTVLLLTDWGCSRLADITSLPFVDLPDPAAVQRAYNTLVDLGAVEKVKTPQADERYMLTEQGRAICKLPTHPRLATAIANANTPEALVAAIVTASFLDDDAGVRFGREADLCCRIRDVLKGDTSTFVRQNVVQYATRMSREAKESLLSIMKDPSRVDNVLRQVGEAILPGFIDLVAQRKGDASYGGSTYMLSLGRSARLDDERDSPEFIVVAETSTSDDGITRIRSYSPISIECLYKVAQERDMTFTVPSRGYEVRSRRCLMVGSLELSSIPLPAPSGEELSRILLETIRSLGGVNKALLQNLAKDTRASIEELRARVRLASSLTADDSMDWPACFSALDALDNDSATQSQIAVAEDLVEPWLSSAGSLKKLNMFEILRASLTTDQLTALDALFPARIEAPDGTRIPIHYASGTPTASAKLQQFLGTTDSPSVGPAGNRVPVSLSLLSPAGKPLAQTNDLAFFWKETYPAVRSEMRGRYAKHPWPEDPVTAMPTRQTKKQQNLLAGDNIDSKSGGKKKPTKKRRR